MREGFFLKTLMRPRLLKLLRVLTVCVALSPLGEIFAQVPAPAVSGPREVPAYQKTDPLQGVWNDGQAALWDLHVIDHYLYFGPQSRARGYKPEQPIKFSHITHVQQNKMECQYCHWNVTKSGYAAVPEVQTCQGCHTLVAGRTAEQQWEVAKLRTFWMTPNEAQPAALQSTFPLAFPKPNEGEQPSPELASKLDTIRTMQSQNSGRPIPWVNVHVMPAHVNFNHKRHVKAGVACHECHGMVPKMEVVERASSMKMGWCIDCHRQMGSSIDCLTCHK